MRSNSTAPQKLSGYATVIGMCAVSECERWQVKPKRIYRLYAEGLIVRTQKRKEPARLQRISVFRQDEQDIPTRSGTCISVTERLPNGPWTRALTVVDQFTRECLAAWCCSLTGSEREELATALDDIVTPRGTPKPFVSVFDFQDEF
jgi:hypothetical protein